VNPSDPHAGAPVASAGPAAGDARALVIAIHGRGDSAQGILGLKTLVTVPRVAWWAPQAQGHSWYPYNFMVPIEENQPWVDSALANISGLVQTARAEGVPREKIVLSGFSQGGCLSLEWAARNPGGVAAVVGLSGGLIGAAGRDFVYDGQFPGTPVFLGCSDVDPFIPLGRVEESADALRAMGATVEKRIYPGMPHTVNQDEVDWFTAILLEITEAASGDQDPG
jgi:phospholipase/carboxylesterase